MRREYYPNLNSAGNKHKSDWTPDSLQSVGPERYRIRMRMIVTAGPTREYVDTVRFISNASSGRMGCTVAAAAIRNGHDVTLLLGPGLPASVRQSLPENCQVVPFISAADLKDELERRFPDCDALVMAAAVGDFRVEKPFETKLSRSAGPVTLLLAPSEDVLASVARSKRDDQVVIAFAVEEGAADQIEAKALAELKDKNADYVVVNTPAAIGAQESLACILSADGVSVPWSVRPKDELASDIVRLAAKGR